MLAHLVFGYICLTDLILELQWNTLSMRNNLQLIIYLCEVFSQVYLNHHHACSCVQFAFLSNTCSDSFSLSAITVRAESVGGPTPVVCTSFA